MTSPFRRFRHANSILAVALLSLATAWLAPGGSRDAHAAGSVTKLFPGEEPAVSPDGRTLAFRRWSGGSSQIFLAPLDGSSKPRALTTGRDMNRSPAWSPDGRSLCYVSNRESNKDLWIVDLDAPDAPRRLTTNSGPDEDPAWSPSGRLIAYVATVRGRTDVYVVRTGGGEPIRLTDDAYIESQPTWSPDGTRIAFAAERETAQNLWMVGVGHAMEDPIGSAAVFNLKQLTSGPHVDTDPAWQPGGNIIVFSSNRLSDLPQGFEEREREAPPKLFRVSAGQRPLLTMLSASPGAHSQPAWTPDGADVLFVRTPWPPGAGGEEGVIHRVRRAGGKKSKKSRSAKE